MESMSNYIVAHLHSDKLGKFIKIISEVRNDFNFIKKHN